MNMEAIREREMADAIARAEEQDEVEESERRYVRPQPPHRAAGDVYTFRLRPDRRDQLRDAAHRAGLPPATLIRQWVENQLDTEARHAASIASVERASIAVGSYTKGSTVRPIRDIDTLAEWASRTFSEKQLLSLIVVGSLLPDLAVATHDLYTRMASALSDLDDVKERIVQVIGEAGLTDLFTSRGETEWERFANLSQVVLNDVSPPNNRRARSNEDPASEPAATEAQLRRSHARSAAINARHIVPNPDGGWDVKAPGSARASSHSDTQAEAVKRAREILHNAGGGEIVIHGRDGRIRNSDTVAPANDPGPRRARR
jgi:uncharacterized protein DUF2188